MKSFDNDKEFYSSFSEEELTGGSARKQDDIPVTKVDGQEVTKTKFEGSDVIRIAKESSVPEDVIDMDLQDILGINGFNSVDDLNKKILRRDNDNIPDAEVTLKNHDDAIKYYIENVIAPKVHVGDEIVSVPALYSTPERWSSIKKKGYLRDRNNRIVKPLILFSRTSMAGNDGLVMNKLDANNPHNFYTVYQKYSPNNPFDKFAALNGQPQRGQIYTVQIPDYVILTYEFIIWANKVEQMNEIQEKFNYAKNSYWGDKNRFKFLANIDSFNNSTEVGDGEDRHVKCTFNLTLNGYLLPKTFNDQRTTNYAISPKKVVIKSEIVTRKIQP